MHLRSNALSSSDDPSVGDDGAPASDWKNTRRHRQQHEVRKRTYD